MIDRRWELFLVGRPLAAAPQAALSLRRRRTRDATLVDAGRAFSRARTMRRRYQRETSAFVPLPPRAAS